MLGCSEDKNQFYRRNYIFGNLTLELLWLIKLWAVSTYESLPSVADMIYVIKYILVSMLTNLWKVITPLFSIWRFLQLNPCLKAFKNGREWVKDQEKNKDGDKVSHSIFVSFCRAIQATSGFALSWSRIGPHRFTYVGHIFCRCACFQRLNCIKNLVLCFDWLPECCNWQYQFQLNR